MHENHSRQPAPPSAMEVDSFYRQVDANPMSGTRQNECGFRALCYGRCWYVVACAAIAIGCSTSSDQPVVEDGAPRVGNTSLAQCIGEWRVVHIEAHGRVEEFDPDVRVCVQEEGLVFIHPGGIQRLVRLSFRESPGPLHFSGMLDDDGIKVEIDGLAALKEDVLSLQFEVNRSKFEKGAISPPIPTIIKLHRLE